MADWLGRSGGAEVPSLSGAELSLCREITEEIKSESDLSSLLSGLCSTPGPSAHSRRAALWPKPSCWQTCSWCATDLFMSSFSITVSV